MGSSRSGVSSQQASCTAIRTDIAVLEPYSRNDARDDRGFPIGTVSGAIGFCYKPGASNDHGWPGFMPRSEQRLPSLQQLRAFEAVAGSESISAAAKAIHLSQPSVTQAIGDLERKVGAALFDRRRSGCYLTAAGGIFRPR